MRALESCNRSCWLCQGPAHEPASCQQVRMLAWHAARRQQLPWGAAEPLPAPLTDVCNCACRLSPGASCCSSCRPLLRARALRGCLAIHSPARAAAHAFRRPAAATMSPARCAPLCLPHHMCSSIALQPRHTQQQHKQRQHASACVDAAHVRACTPHAGVPARVLLGLSGRLAGPLCRYWWLLRLQPACQR